MGKRLALVWVCLEPATLGLQDHARHLESDSGMIFNRSETATGGKVLDSIRRYGMLHVPESFKVTITASLPFHPAVKSYGENLHRVLSGIGIHAEIGINSFTETSRRIDSGHQFEQEALLIALDGQQGDPVTEEETMIHRNLTSHGIGFRFFSLKNNQQYFSALNQVCDLITIAGGTSWGMRLPWPEESKNTFILGVDLGHPSQSNNSILSGALCDHRGNLIQGWRTTQSRDETACPENLMKMLWQVREVAAARTCSGLPRFLILRDGRLHSGERVDTYRTVLGPQLSFADLSKRPNCHMFDENLQPAAPGSAIFGDDGEHAWFTSCPPPFNQQMVNIQKVRMKNSWDGLGIGLRCLTSILVGLSYAPCLGNRPHRSPSPIHWADGFADASSGNLRFLGLPCESI